MDNEAPFTAGTDVDTQSRVSQNGTKYLAQVEINDQTPLLQGTGEATVHEESMPPGGGTDAPETEPRTSWRSASVSYIPVSFAVLLDANIIPSRFSGYCPFFCFICLGLVGRSCLKST